ncbi:hypothetical protein AcW1_003826 [Taiwanofungus camphoratus]|nr:hypothetical protein AcW1_003826 [Antrodia cinnamomea]
MAAIVASNCADTTFDTASLNNTLTFDLDQTRLLNEHPPQCPPPFTSRPGPSVVPPIPPSLPNHRLLYRGSLSLPDSTLLLDGISFVAALSGSSNSLPDATNITTNANTSTSNALLNHPLALALESMRGRSLRFLGTIKRSGVWIDEKEDGIGTVDVEIHPLATLSQMYFENVFCLTPTTSDDDKSEVGVKVGLGDSNDPGSLDVLIYAQLLPDPSSSSSLTVSSTSRAQPRMIRLRAARILPGPPPPALQNPRPRPDEPAPRAPPWMLFSSASKRKRDEEAGGNGKRSKAEVRAKDREASVEALRKAREVMLRMPRPGTNAAASGQDAKAKEKDRDKTSSKGKGKATGNMGEFKIPSVPSRVRSMSGTGLNSTEEEKLEADDVFGSFDDMGNVRKEKMTQDPDEVERSNKTVSDTYLAAKVNCVGYFFSCYKVIKQATVRALADAGIVKGHPEFNDLFQYIYRGTAFALRAKMRTGTVDLWQVYKAVDTHARMYVQNCQDAGRTQM